MESRQWQFTSGKLREDFHILADLLFVSSRGWLAYEYCANQTRLVTIFTDTIFVWQDWLRLYGKLAGKT